MVEKWALRDALFACSSEISRENVDKSSDLIKLLITSGHLRLRFKKKKEKIQRQLKGLTIKAKNGSRKIVMLKWECHSNGWSGEVWRLGKPQEEDFIIWSSLKDPPQ